MISLPLLSVIVPCYNVEKYINKCISSIVAQTYPNLEILLINDGSTDQTGMLCDAWQAKDSRVQVIHQQNEGPSYTRKTGIEKAMAEYVTFVDADDWIDENMYSDMMNALLSTNSDIAQCGVCTVSENDKTPSKHKEGSFEIVDRVKGTSLMIEDKEWHSYMWNKIFKKYLFDQIEFPKRWLCEDVTIMHILFHRASQTVCLRDKYYFYYQRAGSITQTSISPNYYEAYLAFYERHCFVEQHPEYHSSLFRTKNNVIFHGIRTLRYSIIYPQCFPENFSDLLFQQLQALQLSLKDIDKKEETLLIRVEISVFLSTPTCYKWLIMLIAKTIQFLRLNKVNR